MQSFFHVRDEQVTDHILATAEVARVMSVGSGICIVMKDGSTITTTTYDIAGFADNVLDIRSVLASIADE